MVTWRQQLEEAIALARPECLECADRRPPGKPYVTVEDRPALGSPVAVTHHWQLEDGSWCPGLDGGTGTFQCYEDLLAALEPYLFLADYGEDVWSRRQLAAA